MSISRQRIKRIERAAIARTRKETASAMIIIHPDGAHGYQGKKYKSMAEVERVAGHIRHAWIITRPARTGATA